MVDHIGADAVQDLQAVVVVSGGREGVDPCPVGEADPPPCSYRMPPAYRTPTRTSRSHATPTVKDQQHFRAVVEALFGATVELGADHHRHVQVAAQVVLSQLRRRPSCPRHSGAFGGEDGW